LTARKLTFGLYEYKWRGIFSPNERLEGHSPKSLTYLGNCYLRRNAYEDMMRSIDALRILLEKGKEGEVVPGL
jgi:hypothetical protein